MSETRICHFCGTRTDTYCPLCTQSFENRKNAELMTGEERAKEMIKLAGPLEYKFDLVHQRIEELVGRPVWTHEMGCNWTGLVEEARTREVPKVIRRW